MWDPRQTVITRGYDRKLLSIDLLLRKLNEEFLCCYTRTWIYSLSAFRPMIQTQQKDWNGNNKSMGCRTNCKRSRNKRSSYVSRLIPCNRTCSFWDMIWCATHVAMNGRYSTTEEHSNSRAQTEGLINFSTPNTTRHFTALNESNFKSFTRNAYKRIWQCAMEDATRQCVMDIWPYSKFGLLSSKLLNQNVL